MKGHRMNRRSVSRLSDLHLCCEDYRELRRQGFVSCEIRKNVKYFKLRYRKSGDQKVFGIGRDEQAAARIRRELEILQRRHHNRKLLQKLRRQANELLRTAKIALVAKIAEWGFDFHGHEIRHRRSKIVSFPCSVANEHIGFAETASENQKKENQHEYERRQQRWHGCEIRCRDATERGNPCETKTGKNPTIPHRIAGSRRCLARMRGANRLRSVGNVPDVKELHRRGTEAGKLICSGPSKTKCA